MSCLRSASIGALLSLCISGMYVFRIDLFLPFCYEGALVAAINGAGSNPAVQGFFAPVLDGPEGILPDLPSALITSGKFHAVDFVGGHCTNDGRTFVGGTPDDFKTDADIVDRVFGRFDGRVVGFSEVMEGIWRG